MRKEAPDPADQKRIAGKIMSIVEAGRNEGVFDDDDVEIGGMLCDIRNHNEGNL